MNKYFKLMSAALAVTALASCSDSLDLGKQDLSNLQEGEMLATIDPLKDDVGTRVAVVSGGQVVWADDDEVNVYSFDKLAHNTYVVSAGAGTDKATLTPKEGSDKTKLSGKKYAVAQPEDNKDVRISASEDGKTAILQAKVPYEFEWGTIQANGKDAYKLASPYWGEVAGENPFSCNFHALTAYLKLDLADIPAGTKSIMITTHEDITFGQIEDLNDPAVEVVSGGANEPLSGNFEAELVDATSKLQASGDLNAKDYFRINFDESDVDMDKLFYIPVIAQKYQKLYVIAVKEYGKSKYAIREGEILKVYDNEEFQVGVAKSASLGALQEFNVADYADPVVASKALSDMIALAYDGKHTVRVLVNGDLGDLGGDIDILIANNTEKKNNVEIIFANAQTQGYFINFREAPATIMGWLVNWGTATQIVNSAAAGYVTENGTKGRTVSVKFADNLNPTQNDVNFVLPTSYVNFETAFNFQAVVNVLAAKSDASKPLSAARDVAAKSISANDAKDAPIVIHSSSDVVSTINAVFVQPQSKHSSIYVYNPETNIQRLGIGTKDPGTLRLTDALVWQIAYENALWGAPQGINNEANIYTDGSAAIGGGANGVTGANGKVQVKADWTGKALTREACALGYDQSDVFTCAQLASLGMSENTYNYIIADRVNNMWLGGSEYQWIGAVISDNDDITLQPTSPVTATNQAVTIDGNFKDLHNMYVSIDDPYYTDPHSCCTTCGSNDVKIEQDLGLIRGIYTRGTVTIQNIRLNDALIETNDYKIPNAGSITGIIAAGGDVTLLDNQTSNVRVQNVGNRFKFVSNGTTYISGFTQAQIDAMDPVDVEKFVNRQGNAGGQVGVIATQGNVTMNTLTNRAVNGETNVTTKPNDKGGLYVTTVGHNAGGLIGSIIAPRGFITANRSTVRINEISAEKGSNVGGIAGQMIYGADNDFIHHATIDVKTIKATELGKEATSVSNLNVISGNNAGGLVGLLRNDNIAQGAANNVRIDGKVKVKVATELTAGNQFAGGLAGQVTMLADGFQDAAADQAILWIASDIQTTRTQGVVNADPTTLDEDFVIDVDIAALTATNGYAGGLVGENVSGDIKLVADYKGTSGTKTSIVDVKLGSLNTAFAGGGIDGQNLDYVTVSAKADGDHINVTVDKWTNTWAAANFDGGYAGMSSNTLQKLCGSFSHGLGQQQEGFNIYKTNFNGGETVLIPNATKKALFFQKHTDATNTTGDPSDPFWGDMAGYVGYSNKSGVYLINGNPNHGDQDFNYRSTFGGTY